MGINFSEPEKLAVIFDSDNREEWQRTSYIIDCLSLDKTLTIADIGAGTGYFSNIFSEKAGHVYAIDCEQNMVTYLKNRFENVEVNNISIIQSDFTDPCIPDNVDIVFMANTYRFILDRDLFLKNMFDQVYSKTRIFFVDFKGEHARVSLATANKEVCQAGFDVQKIDIVSCPDHYIMQFMKPNLN